MITLIILATIAATCFLLIELRKLRRASTEAEAGIQELDLDAMTNLLDEHQAEFVRAHLSPTAYRRYARGKNQVLLAYLGVMSTFLNARIRTLTAPAAELASDSPQLDLFVHARELVLRAQILLWLSFLFPAGAQLSHSAQEYCRALATSFRDELVIDRRSLAS